MNKIAEVFIDTNSKAIDKSFDYLADDGIRAGMRVKVPFGKGNRASVGYVTGFKEKSEYKNLKKIICAVDEEPMLDEKAIELAKYIKRTCLCSMSAAIKLMLPPSAVVKYTYEIELADTEGKTLTKSGKLIVETLLGAGGKMEIGMLKDACGISGETALNKLIEQGVVTKTEVSFNKLSSLNRKFVTLLCEDIEEARQDLKLHAKRALKGFEILEENGSVMLSELAAVVPRASIDVLVKRGYAEIEEKEVYRRSVDEEAEEETVFLLTDEQKNALSEIEKCINAEENTNFLLHGVTGSGKTEVFLRAAKLCIEKGKTAVILVPEISLTPQMTRRFLNRFKESVALLHSGLSAGERYDEWRRIKKGEVKLVIGARSAIFAPLDNIGLIIVDEEHENSYKSESVPKYDAVLAAQFRGKQHNCAVILASATPKVESYYNAVTGKYKLLTMSERISHNMPEIRLVDMSGERLDGNILSSVLKEEIGENIRNGEQTILFLNRRGYSTFMTCRKCGFTLKCPHCSVTLTYHSKKDRMVCHYCGYETDAKQVCPDCGSLYIKYGGTGTQKVEEELKTAFPEISVIRVDADTTAGKQSHKKLFDRFRNENINVMIGTQMVTKGLDFPNVTLVGVLNADAVLNMDDYKSGETAFSQFTQVCGRAGRDKKKGRAVIQTYNVNDPILRLVKKQSYREFFDREIKSRQLLLNPPFSKLVNIVFSGNTEAEAEKEAQYMDKVIAELWNKNPGLLVMKYGPTPAPIEKIKNRYRYRLLYKTAGSIKILDIFKAAEEIFMKRKTDVLMDITVNPTSVL